MESWVLTRTMEKKIEAFEMYMYRRMLKISYNDDSVTIPKCYRKWQKKQNCFIYQKNLEYYGHLNRNIENTVCFGSFCVEK